MWRHFLLVGAALYTVAAAAPPAAKRGPSVLVVADAKPAEAAARLPTAESPVYYFILGMTERGLGAHYAGEKMPAPATVEAQVVAMLAQRHYLRTQVGGPKPSLGLFILWGTANAATDDIPNDGGTVLYNAREMRQLLGADKAGVRHNTDPFENEQINEALNEDRAYVMLGAFDAEALSHKKKNLVWRTSMSVEVLHHSLPDSLAVMLESAAPYVGQNADRGHAVDDSARRKAQVEVGDLKVIKLDVPAGKK